MAEPTGVGSYAGDPGPTSGHTGYQSSRFTVGARNSGECRPPKPTPKNRGSGPVYDPTYLVNAVPDKNIGVEAGAGNNIVAEAAQSLIRPITKPKNTQILIHLRIKYLF
jgi:hypothetical protein